MAVGFILSSKFKNQIFSYVTKFEFSKSEIIGTHPWTLLLVPRGMKVQLPAVAKILGLPCVTGIATRAVQPPRAAASGALGLLLRTEIVLKLYYERVLARHGKHCTASTTA